MIQFILLVFLVIPTLILDAQVSTDTSQPVLLEYRQHRGEVLYAESLVNESVFINGRYSHNAEITETSVSIVHEVNGDDLAVLDTTFRTVEKIKNNPSIFEWLSSETVRLSRDSRGRMVVPDDAVRPVLRNIPVFPDYPVKAGDSWTASAEEVHIFRTGGRLAGPYRDEIPVSYEYLKDVQRENKRFAEILIRYNIYLPVNSPGEPVYLISGRSEQSLFWDIQEGRPVSKTEDFEFLMMMSNGTIQEFRGHQDVVYRYTLKLDRGEVTDVIRRGLGEIPGISIDSVVNGVLLSLEEGEEVLFQAESAQISTEQLYRLEVLRTLLQKYVDRDILITGYTAHFGTEEGRRKLSQERAAAVAGVLFPQGRTGSGKLYLRGVGSNEALASEGSEAGRSANRRVEILILD